MYCIMKFMRLGSWHHHQTCETDHSAPMDHATKVFPILNTPHRAPHYRFIRKPFFTPDVSCLLIRWLFEKSKTRNQTDLVNNQYDNFLARKQTQIRYFSFQRIISQNGLAATLYGHIFYFNPLIVPFI